MTNNTNDKMYGKGIQLYRQFGTSKMKYGFVSYIIRIALILIGSFNALITFDNAFDLGDHKLFIILTAVGVVGIGMAIHRIPKKFFRVIAGFAAVFAAIIFFGPSNILKGFELLTVKIESSISGGIDMYSTLWNKSNPYILNYASAFVYAITVLVTSLICAATIERVNLGIHMLATVPLYLCTFTLTEFSGISVFIMVAYYVLCYVAFRSDLNMSADCKYGIGVFEKKSTSAVSSQVTALVFIISAVLLLGYSIVCPKVLYKKNQGIENAKENVLEFLEDFSFEDFFDNLNGDDNDSNIATGGLNQGTLGRVDRLQLSDSTALTVTLQGNVKGNIYIRDYLSSDYYSGSKTSDGLSQWGNILDSNIRNLASAVDDEDAFRKLANLQYDIIKYGMDIYAMGYDLGTIRINAPLYSNIYQPYYLKTVSNVNEHLQISLLSPVEKTDDSNEYQFYFAYRTGGTKLPPETLSRIGNSYLSQEGMESIKDIQERYEEGVYQNYMTVPDALGTFRSTFGNLKFDSLSDCVDYINNYFSGFEYTLSPGATPSGEDFVEWFLFEQRKGYCSYFATAATLMLREFGYPARYVEGYMFNTSGVADGNPNSLHKYNVSDKAAHAWTEVYVDDFGWVVLEFTPSSGIGERDDAVNGVETVTEETTTPDNEETTTNREPETTSKEKPAEKETEKKEPDKNAGRTGKALKHAIVWVIYAVAAAAIPLAVCIIGYRRKRKLGKISQLLESNKSEERYEAFKMMIEDLIAYTKADIISYETRAANTTALMTRMTEMVNKGKKEPVEVEISEDEYRFTFTVLDMGQYSHTMPDIISIKQAADTVVKANDILYKERNMFDRCVIKYFKCLYLTDK